MRRFEVHAVARASRARTGALTTDHGVIPTPMFMPVGTRGTVRTQTLGQLEALAPPILLANTLHLLVRPGVEVLARLGGLHRLIGWRGAILTDSGGFQVFSLARSCAVTDDGVELQLAADGPRIALTAERSIAVQRAIGSDIAMVFDHCVAATSSQAETRDAMARTHRWALRSLAAHRAAPPGPQLFAIVQGGRFGELRRESAAELTAIEGFDGYAIGGLAVGESRREREDITELVAGELPAASPRYLMGVGTPLDILEAVHRGVDLFDCILPTAWAQHGRAFTARGKLDLRKGLHRFADAPLADDCACDACARHSRAYLHHLIKAREPLGWQLLANHNLRFYLDLMAEIRAAIAADTFAAFHAARRDVLARASDGDG